MKKAVMVLVLVLFVVSSIAVSAQDDCTWLCQLKNRFIAGGNLKGENMKWEALKCGNCA